jgi:hypothetical protein
VFVSSFAGSAELNGNPGILQADAICDQAAKNAGLPNAGTPGAYLAWIAGAGAQDMPAVRFNKQAPGWALHDGTLVACSWSELISGTLRHAINQDEGGGGVTLPTQVWTDVDTSGARQTTTTCCADTNGTCWGAANSAGSAIYGDATKTNGEWTNSMTNSTPFRKCSDVAHVYCFEQ